MHAQHACPVLRQRNMGTKNAYSIAEYGKLQQIRALPKDLARTAGHVNKQPHKALNHFELPHHAISAARRLQRAAHAAATSRSRRTSPSDSAAASTGPALSATPGRQHTAVTNSPAALARPADTDRIASGVAQLVW